METEMLEPEDKPIITNSYIEKLVDEALAQPMGEDWLKVKKEQRCVVIDIDGTLADVDSGLEYDKDGKLNWENFVEKMPEYPPNEWCVRLAQIYYQTGFVVYIVTARPERTKDVTVKWLEKHGIPYDFLFMQKGSQSIKAEEFKKGLLMTQLPKKELIEFVVEDTNRVAKMWREEGLTVLHCADNPK